MTTGKVGGSYDGWLAPPTPVRPWMEGEREREQEFELLIVITPTMGQLFKKDLKGLPFIPQYRRRVMRVRAEPVMEKPTQIAIAARPFHEKPSGISLFSGARITREYDSPTFNAEPRQGSFFHRVFYGNTLYGKNIIALAKAIMEDEDPFSFEFEAKASEWKNAFGQIQAFTHSSSFVGNVQYRPESSEMDIILAGRTYTFCRVPMRIFEAFEASPSKGNFFNTTIKGNYNC